MSRRSRRRAGEDYLAIRHAVEALDLATKPFARRRMNRAIAAADAGRPSLDDATLGVAARSRGRDVMPKLTFKNPYGKGSAAVTVEARAGASLLEVAEECGARVGHACGGNLACSTCHVYVEQGVDSLGEITDKENDIMDKAFDVRAESRLGLPGPLGEADVEVEITEESLKAWLDEDLTSRRAQAMAQLRRWPSTAP
jgi:2Fe-2S ferredoxin